MGFFSYLKTDELFFPTLMVLCALAALSFESVLKNYQQKISDRPNSIGFRILDQIANRLHARRPLHVVVMLAGLVWLAQTLVQNSWAAH